ncbi:MAG: FKBP-type peptidyl-prolyl cis-trans isomerase [Thermoplasmata archaeon]|nr:MAG: FKBP-type peptidyl-prolyl cis-trans isomerase [Thermoplasmata archaeon]
MAKRRSTIGKKGKHGREGVDISLAETMKRRKRKILSVVLVIVIVVAILASVYYFFFLSKESDDDVDVLTSSSKHLQGYPNDTISYTYTIHNPSSKSDVFSPMLFGLPSDWTIIMPNTISVKGKESKQEQFSVIPKLETAVNNTYPFKLNVTSANTQKTSSVDFEITVYRLNYGVELVCYNTTHDADPGRNVLYGILVRNTGNGEDSFSFSYKHLPPNWTISFEFDQIVIPGYGSKSVIVNISTHINTSKGRYDMDIMTTSSGGPTASIWLNTSTVKDFDARTIKEGDRIQVNYIGYFPDGVVFDTSYAYVANNTNWSKTPGFTRTEFSPLKVATTTREGDYTTVVIGFKEGLMGLKVGESNVVRVPPEKAYGDGLWRIFEIDIVSIDN